MALACETGDGAIRTTGLVAANSDYTCLLTFRVGAAPTGGDYRTIFALRNADYSAYVGVFSDPDSNDFALEADDGGGSSITTTVAFEADIRGSIAYVRSGTTQTLYCNGDAIDDFTLDLSGETWADMVLGDDGTSVGGIEIQYFREWGSALTLAQIFAEWNSPTDVVAAATDTPLVSDLLDDSGNGHDWSAVGTPTFVAGPTPLPRTNTTALTAYEIPSLPASIYQVAKDSTGSTTDLWFTYTADGESMFNAFAVGAIAGDYDFSTQMWEGPAASPVGPLVGSTNRPIQYPATEGTTYLWQLDKPGVPANAAGAAWFSLVAAENASVPAGSLIIPTDFLGVPETRISATTGDVLRYGPAKGIGESGDILPSGIFLMDNNHVGSQLELYSATSELITTLVFDWGGVDDPAIRACTGGNKFYVATGGSGGMPPVMSAVSTVLPTGEFGPTTWELAHNNVVALAASNDETTLYYATFTDSTIYRWDLSGDVALTNFKASVADTRIVDILVLTDDTILAGYEGIFPNTTYIVRRYNAAGTLLNTYDFGSDVASDRPRLATALDDPDSFWVWLHDESGDVVMAQFKNVETSSGTYLTEFELPEYSENILLTDERAEPVDPRPSTHSSCPFFIARNAASAGGIVVTKTTIPATDTTSFTFTAGGGLSPASFTLANGESQILTAAPGTGYSLTETVDASVYATSFNVSNGSDIDDITVGDGETVTVTVTNQTTQRLPRRWVLRTPVLG